VILGRRRCDRGRLRAGAPHAGRRGLARLANNRLVVATSFVGARRDLTQTLGVATLQAPIALQLMNTAEFVTGR
jgi:hypothetical protein